VSEFELSRLSHPCHKSLRTMCGTAEAAPFQGLSRGFRSCQLKASVADSEVFRNNLRRGLNSCAATF
jgi:hypothetical protein